MTIHTFSEITPKMRTKLHGTNMENLGHSHQIAPALLCIKLHQDETNENNSLWLDVVMKVAVVNDSA